VEEAVTMEAAFDVTLALTLVTFAAVLLTTSDRFEAIVLFIVFGLLMAVTWGRFGAVDIALAEAAIGAGITGAMLLNARGDLEARETPEPRAPPSRMRRLALISLLLAFAGAVAIAVLCAPRDAAGMREPAFDALPASGVENPVTAVLLNYRAYDTWLELVVLLVAVIGTWSQGIPRIASEDRKPGLVLDGTMRLIVPLSILIGGYLLWRGSHAPGGAFQAGAVVAGAGVLFLLAGRRFSRRWMGTPLRVGLAAAVVAFGVIGFVTLARGDPFLFYRHQAASWVILALEVMATVAIASTLIALFSGAAPQVEEDAR
jgi:multisubunit Na+/H+ antiporter MnhB subunit